MVLLVWKGLLWPRRAPVLVRRVRAHNGWWPSAAKLHDRTAASAFIHEADQNRYSALMSDYIRLLQSRPHAM